MTYATKRILSSVTTVTLMSLAACISEMPRTLPTAPTATYRTLFTPSYVPEVSSASLAARPVSYPNRSKYSDKGVKTTLVRAGTAAIDIRALLDKNGETLVEVTTGTFAGQPAEGTIEKVQLTVPGSESAPYNSRPDASEWSTSLTGLVPGDRIAVQANVRGAGMSRTYVLIGNTPVARRPDLAVLSVTGTAQSFPGDPVTFIAQVRELNGDLGARANCRLFVDGTPVDQATGIWVDAGDMVSCQFSYAFASIGTHTVSVGLLDVAPGDWDLDNNTGTTSIAVVLPGTPIDSGKVIVEDIAYTYQSTFTRTGTRPVEQYTGGSEAWSRVTFFGKQFRPIPAPLQRMDIKLSTGGTTIYESSISQFLVWGFNSGGTIYRCVQFDATGESASSCSVTMADGTGWTTFNYAHQSGTVTYYGETFCHYVGCNSYTPNGSETTGWGQQYGLSLGTPVRVQIAVFDAQGEKIVADASVILADSSATPHETYNANRSSCFPNHEGGETCSSYVASGTRWFGEKGWYWP